MSRASRWAVAVSPGVLLLTIGGILIGVAVLAARVVEPTSAPMPCPANVTSVEVFNTYGDHEMADRQQIVGAEASDASSLLLARSAYPATFASSDLGRAATTVVRFTSDDGRETTVWIFQLVAPNYGTAIVFSTGESLQVPNVGLGRYLAPDAQVVPRSEVPQR